MNKLLLLMCVSSAFLLTCNGIKFEHLILDGETLTYASARQECQQRGMDLCTHSQICRNNVPIVTDAEGEDSWVPILDLRGDWTQIGDHRLCMRHVDEYGYTSWGDITGVCKPWGSSNDPCPHKKHVLCCDGVQINIRLTTWESGRAFCLNQGKDLCRVEDICHKGNAGNLLGNLVDMTWAPVRNKYNKWLQIEPDNSCTDGGFQSWGNVATEGIEGANARVFCCDDNYYRDTLVKPNMFHFYLDSSSLTWNLAENFCQNIPGFGLCSSKEICPEDVPAITGAIPGDHWAPISDTGFDYNNWIEIGMDKNMRANRVCMTHDRYGATSWGDITGQCPPWNNSINDCPHKGNVFCCKQK